MRAVAAGLRTQWDDNGTTLRDALDLMLEDAEFGRIDKVIRRIDREKRCANLLQVRPGIVVVRGLNLIQQVIGIGGLERGGNRGVQPRVAFCEGREIPLTF